MPRARSRTRRPRQTERRRTRKPLIPAQPAAPALDTVSLRLDHDLHEHLKAYAEFVGGSKDYIISQVLQRVLRPDKDFAAWVETRARQTAEPPASGRASSDAASGATPTAATTWTADLPKSTTAVECASESGW